MSFSYIVISRFSSCLSIASHAALLLLLQISSVQPASRPLSVWGVDIPFIKHTGVVATLQDGSRHFLHKTPKGTNAGNTAVITSARDMSRKWKVGPEQRARAGVTVGDLVKAPGGNYHWLCSNCWGASNKMMKTATNK